MGDPLAGMEMPAGDPAPLTETALRLSSWATHLGAGAAGHRGVVGSVVNVAWVGPEATRTGHRVTQIADAAATLGACADRAAGILHHCASRWAEAVAAWGRARLLADQVLDDEWAHRDREDYLSPERGPAFTAGMHAVEEANAAISAAVFAMEELRSEVRTVRSMPNGQFGELLAGIISAARNTRSALAPVLGAAYAAALHRHQGGAPDTSPGPDTSAATAGGAGTGVAIQAPLRGGINGLGEFVASVGADPRTLAGGSDWLPEAGRRISAGGGLSIGAASLYARHPTVHDSVHWVGGSGNDAASNNVVPFLGRP